MNVRIGLIGSLFLGCAACVPLQQAPIYPPQPVYSPPQVQPAVIVHQAPKYPSAPVEAAPLAVWRLASSPLLEGLAGGGAERLQVRATDGSETVEIHAVIVDSTRCRLQVIDQPQSNAGGSIIASALRSSRAIAGVNGGFFTPEFAPLGKMIAGGVNTGTVSNAKLLSGMFLVAEGQPYLIWRDEYAGDAGVTDLIQSGPRLVNGGRSMSGLERAKARPRTFIATDGGSKWVIGLVRSTSLGGLSDLLASPGIFPNLTVRRALNLDGGNSSAIWMIPQSGRDISEPGWSTVRNFIAVSPR